MKKISLVLASLLLIASALLCTSCAKPAEKAFLKGYEDKPFSEYVEQAWEAAKANAEQEEISYSCTIYTEDGWNASKKLNENTLIGSQKAITYIFEAMASNEEFSSSMTTKLFMIFDTDTNTLDVAGARTINNENSKSDENWSYDNEVDADEAWKIVKNMIELPNLEI